MRLSIFWCLLYFSASSLPAQSTSVDYPLTWQGVTRHYLVHMPAHADSGQPLPVVMVLHGLGGSGPEMLHMGHWAMFSNAHNVLVVAPDGEPQDLGRPAGGRDNLRGWNDGSGVEPWASRQVDDIGFLGAVLDSVAHHYTIERTQVYVAGFSNGASLAWRVASEMGDRVAAVAPVSGLPWIIPGSLTRPVPVMFTIGTGDPLNHMNGGRTRKFLTPDTYIMRQPVMTPLNAWAQLLHCHMPAPVASVAHGVETITYEGCATDYQVLLVDGMGHHWPGGEDMMPASFAGEPSDSLNATEAIWQFFDRHRLASASH